VYNKELDAFVAEESAIALFENGHLTMEGVYKRVCVEQK
jgi:hypothetical protein